MTPPSALPVVGQISTSDFKRAQVTRVLTDLVKEAKAEGATGRVRVLNVLGIRAQESLNRTAMAPFGNDPANWTWAPIRPRVATARPPAHAGRSGIPHGRREVHRWQPVFDLDTAEVWNLVGSSGLPWHPAYDLGMPRLSCPLCFYMPVELMVRAARYNLDLARRYRRVEEITGFRYLIHGPDMGEIIRRAEAAGVLRFDPYAWRSGSSLSGGVGR